MGAKSSLKLILIFPRTWEPFKRWRLSNAIYIPNDLRQIVRCSIERQAHAIRLAAESDCGSVEAPVMHFLMLCIISLGIPFSGPIDHWIVVPEESRLKNHI